MTGPVKRLGTGLTAVVVVLSLAACRPRQRPAPTASPKRVAEIAVVPADAVRSRTGLASKVLEMGDGGPHPGLRESVTVLFTGWTAGDGRMFNSSGDQPVTFPMIQLIPGWIEGLAGMVRGEKRRLWVPSELAYGDRSSGLATAPPGDLVFDIQLIAIQPENKPPPVPPDLTPVPKNVKRTRSGLAYRILSHGTGTHHPGAGSTVQVHYTGWRTDGHMYNTTTDGREPALFALASAQPGWRESVQLMVVGDKGRFWVPNRLMNTGPTVPPGAGAGMQVLDIELLSIR